MTHKIGAVLAIIFAGLGAVAVNGGEAITDVLRTTTLADLTSGRFAQRMDKSIFNAVPRSAAFDGLLAGLQYSLLRDAGPQVRAGCGDWLYSMEELKAQRDDQRNIQLRVELMSWLVRAVKQHGAIPVIVPVPDKAEQVEDQLCGLAAVQSRLRDRFWGAMTGLDGAIVIDVRRNWPIPGYWRTDTHWDQSGARFAAALIARAINDALGPGQDDISLVEGSLRKRVGDLARLAGLNEAPRHLAPASEDEKLVTAEIKRSGGLLDEIPVPSIILAGSSFSLNSSFPDFLQASLSREVAQLSQPGGGFAGALLDTLERNPNALANAKAVIWEWPMRSLVAPPSQGELSFIKSSKVVP